MLGYADLNAVLVFIFVIWSIAMLTYMWFNSRR